ncbi:fungal-specific transcription factor domain-containing protein [Cadophora sp. MPI-SDFR-AT-0126]|nr:fungal-specific transcription factor domain-containing protein [Leotiomycetes sp. MPI-SDFR-AT-0126]
MQRRSRKGCIDCKKAKVKCDEERPTCGTCKRRGYACQGYAAPVPSTARDRRETSGEEDERLSTPQDEIVEANELTLEDSDVLPSDMDYTEQQITIIARARADSMQLPSCPPIYPTVPDIPPDAIGRTDKPGVEIYFNRHPSELVISKEFVNEMNANVLQVFNQDPAAVAETLSAIGHIYLGEGGQSIVPVLDRKQRILARLRDRRDLEQMMIMLLGLCALELIDGRSEPADTSLPAILSNAAIIIKHQQENGLSFSSVAKYFIRALARQDMMVSLTYARHPLIPHSVWLSEDSYRHADRFMGFTGTLMPILADLGALAEEMRGGTPTPFSASDGANRNGSHVGDEVWSEEAIMITTNPTLAIYQKVLDIRQRLHQWRPVAAQNVPFQASRNLLFHAHAHRAAALLYLHRLLEPPGSSEAADQVALGMAHEVMMHLSAMKDQLKTSLWPVLIAGTELTEEGDRGVVLGMFDEIVRQRKTVTARRTRDFCVQRVWAARDAGLVWNWMDLVEIFPGECLPI